MNLASKSDSWETGRDNFLVKIFNVLRPKSSRTSSQTKRAFWPRRAFCNGFQCSFPVCNFAPYSCWTLWRSKMNWKNVMPWSERQQQERGRSTIVAHDTLCSLKRATLATRSRFPGIWRQIQLFDVFWCLICNDVHQLKMGGLFAPPPHLFDFSHDDDMKRLASPATTNSSFSRHHAEDIVTSQTPLTKKKAPPPAKPPRVTQACHHQPQDPGKFAKAHRHCAGCNTRQQ